MDKTQGAQVRCTLAAISRLAAELPLTEFIALLDDEYIQAISSEHVSFPSPVYGLCHSDYRRLAVALLPVQRLVRDIDHGPSVP